MRKRYTITLSILTIMILLTLTVGTSYSYYSVTDAQEEENVLKSTCFDIKFEEGENSSIKLDGTNSNYAFPMSEESALKLKPYHFTITNTCTAENAANNTKYAITLSPLTSKNELTQYLNYKLVKESDAESATAQKIVRENPSNKYELPESVKAEKDFADTYLLEEDTLAPSASASYNLYLWIPENACEGETCKDTVMGKSFEGSLIVYSTVDTATE